ncbi:hypothetical protein J6590_019498 [Homalodisca vitripennis]|nr:hypothetical protein J6590_019498 [Homalodisca vitripennis]
MVRIAQWPPTEAVDWREVHLRKGQTCESCNLTVMWGIRRHYSAIMRRGLARLGVIATEPKYKRNRAVEVVMFTDRSRLLKLYNKMKFI